MPTPSKESTDRAIYQVTEWADRHSTVTTAHATMRYDHWLQSEVERLADKWTEAWVMAHPDGRIALFKWNNDIKPVEGEDSK